MAEIDEVLANQIDLFRLAGINVERERLYTAAIALDEDTRPEYPDGMYYAVRTVDQDRSPKHWDIYVFFAPGDGRVLLHHLFSQGASDLPFAAGGVAIRVQKRSHNVVVMHTTDAVAGSLYPVKVTILKPWVPGS